MNAYAQDQYNRSIIIVYVGRHGSVEVWKASGTESRPLSPTFSVVLTGVAGWHGEISMSGLLGDRSLQLMAAVIRRFPLSAPNMMIMLTCVVFLTCWLVTDGTTHYMGANGLIHFMRTTFGFVNELMLAEDVFQTVGCWIQMAKHVWLDTSAFWWLELSKNYRS